MTEQKTAQAFLGQDSATLAGTDSKKAMIHLFAQGYSGKLDEAFDFGPVYVPIWNIEDRQLEELRTIPTLGTAVEPMTDALKARGVETDGTLGGLMDAVGFTQDDLHKIVCHCHGAIVSGHQMAERLLKLADAQ